MMGPGDDGTQHCSRWMDIMDNGNMMLRIVIAGSVLTDKVLGFLFLFFIYDSLKPFIRTLINQLSL